MNVTLKYCFYLCLLCIVTGTLLWLLGIWIEGFWLIATTQKLLGTATVLFVASALTAVVCATLGSVVKR